MGPKRWRFSRKWPRADVIRAKKRARIDASLRLRSRGFCWAAISPTLTKFCANAAGNQGIAPRMTVDAEIFVIGAGPGRPHRRLLPDQGNAVRHRDREGPGLCRRHQPHGAATRISCSTSAATASSRSRRRSSTCGTRSCPTISSSGRGCRASIYGGKYYSYPLSAFEALRQSRHCSPAPPACCPIAYAKAFPIATPRTFHDWVRNQFGERLFSIFFKTYTEKVWGMSCDEISADWAAQRIKGLDLGVAVMNALDALAQAASRKPSGRRRCGQDADRELPVSAPGPRHDVGGGGAQDQGARRPGADGPRACSARLTTTTARLWRIEVATADGGRENYTARHVDQLGAGARAGREDLADADLAVCMRAQLRYRDFLTVALMVNKPDLFPDNWIYIHDPAVKVGRVQNFRSWSPEMVPPGMSCLGLEYFCFEGDGLWNAPDAELIALAKTEIAQDRPDRRRRRGRRLRRAPAEGLSGLRRRAIATTSR